jgi:hypothetical protein
MSYVNTGFQEGGQIEERYIMKKNLPSSSESNTIHCVHLEAPQEADSLAPNRTRPLTKPRHQLTFFSSPAAIEFHLKTQQIHSHASFPTYPP